MREKSAGLEEWKISRHNTKCGLYLQGFMSYPESHERHECFGLRTSGARLRRTKQCEEESTQKRERERDGGQGQGKTDLHVTALVVVVVIVVEEED